MVFVIFAIIGFIGLVSYLMYLFTSLGKNASNLSVSESTPKVNTFDFLNNLTVACGGTSLIFDTKTCEIITENSAYFEKLKSDIEAATDNIAIMTYIWEEDSLSMEVYKALQDAVKRGVVVRLLMDAFGTSVSKSLLNDLESAGIQIVNFRPAKVGKLSRYHSRVHRRAYIFDGKIGYFGGSSISKHWFANKNVDDFSYDDVMYRVTGKAVLHIARSFGELWTAYSTLVPQGLYKPNNQDNSDVPVLHNAFSLAHSPQADVHPLTYLLWYSCMCASTNITVVSPYFLPGKALTDLLCQKAKFGVKVIVVTQGTGEVWFVQKAIRNSYNQLLEAGVVIYEHTKPHLHSKVAVIDDCLTICGSANFDIRSQRINFEFVFGVQSTEFAHKNLKILDIYQPVLKQITLETQKKKMFYERIFEFILFRFREQL